MGLSVLCLAGAWVMVRLVMSLRGVLYDFSQKEARLKLLVARDPATGLFQHNGFEVLLTREIERAKRKDYHLALVLIQVEPFDKIKKDISTQAMDRLMFQIAETLQSTCRIYDGLFKLDPKTFCLYFSETRIEELKKIIGRMQKRLDKASFLVNVERVKVTPNFCLGAAVYPMDGTNPQSLEAFARETVSSDFDLSTIKHPERPLDELLESVAASQQEEDPLPEVSVKIVKEPSLSISVSEKSFGSDDLMTEEDENISNEEIIVASFPNRDEMTKKSEIVFEDIDTQSLKDTPEMQDFKSELDSLFARTDKIKEHVGKLLELEEQGVAFESEHEKANSEVIETPLSEETINPFLWPNPQEAVVESAAVAAEEVESVVVQEKSPEPVAKLEPLPEEKAVVVPAIAKPKTTLLDASKIEEIHKRLKDLDRKSEELEAKSNDVVRMANQMQKPAATKAKTAAAQNGQNEAWSVNEIADMPDVVAALMQGEINDTP